MWIDIQERLPEPGIEVPVHGEYTPNDCPKPKARFLAPNDSRRRFGLIWESKEWRGSVAITYWGGQASEAKMSNNLKDSSSIPLLIKEAREKARTARIIPALELRSVIGQLVTVVEQQAKARKLLITAIQTASTVLGITKEDERWNDPNALLELLVNGVTASYAAESDKTAMEISLHNCRLLAARENHKAPLEGLGSYPTVLRRGRHQWDDSTRARTRLVTPTLRLPLSKTPCIKTVLYAMISRARVCSQSHFSLLFTSRSIRRLSHAAGLFVC